MRGSRNLIISLVLLFAFLELALGADDGFGPAQRAEGAYFTVYYASELDPTELARQLNISVTDRVLSGSASREGGSLAEAVDTLFLRASDILDMRLYNFKGNIKICRDYAHLSQAYSNIFGSDIGGMRSFYIYEINTIYFSPESFQRGVAGHEIAHSIISNYFVVQPPVKVAEILAGYIEYQLRKSAQE